MVESKQVRVDNWGIFFLQRLQMFFSKTDYCDLTLQFEGNVQLKVHRLVMNACTEYFTYLEQSYPSMEENTIIMPPDLQSDVIVPIVNFMYTGMLEFQMSIFDKLYKASEIMNINVLTKLLDAQKQPIQPFKPIKKKSEISTPWNSQVKKGAAKVSKSPDLPAMLPGRKLPVWKRKTLPAVPSHLSSHLHFPEQKWLPDPLAIPDNTPKPTRFEWPEDDLPPVNMMDSSFEEISYTSKPLLTQQEEIRASTSFEDVRNNVSSSSKKITSKGTNVELNMQEVEEYVKEQRIRTDINLEESVEFNDVGHKRKMDQNSNKPSFKRSKISDKENKETTISVSSNNVSELDHTKLVTEVLKKYPDLVKKNKNIRLKIMASGNKSEPENKTQNSVKTGKKDQVDPKSIKQPVKPKPKKVKQEEGPWSCHKCIEAGEMPQEFVLYYLYRKHMTDVHHEVFDIRLCRYCGCRCGRHNLMMYHLYTKHGLKPPPSYSFPKCDRCPYIALSEGKLIRHKRKHGTDEVQCIDCKLAFTNKQTLSAHIQITGHYNKPGRTSHDCQYCMKKLQSAINLLSHIKNSHIKDARRDGIVSLDELDEIEEFDDEEPEQEESEEEYMVPEIIPDLSLQKDKVKIISNVKVPIRQDQVGGGSQETQIVPSQPSSEAEAMNTVASSISTSLGLVDIVVLDDNQQYILQQDGQSNQTEFIIPELSSGEHPFAGQVITTQHNSVLPQGIIQTSESDIGSTDELVMVLTDHDYQEENEGENTNNSNIVVLYSHPVNGQQGQFITSQGNLLVNSETGMLEIRNGANIATSSDQIVVSSAEEHIESIEMIQREIDGHDGLKQEPFFEEDKKPEVEVHQEHATESEKILEIMDHQAEPDENLEEVKEHKEIEQNKTTDKETPINQGHEDDIIRENHEVQESTEEENGILKDIQDNVDGGNDCSVEEPMDIDEDIQEQKPDAEDASKSEAGSNSVHSETDETHHMHIDAEHNQSEVSEQSQLEVSECNVSEVSDQNRSDVSDGFVPKADDGIDIPPDKRNCFEHAIMEDSDKYVEINDPTVLGEEQQSLPNDESEEYVDESMEIDGKVNEPKDSEKTQEMGVHMVQMIQVNEEEAETEISKQKNDCDETETEEHPNNNQEQPDAEPEPQLESHQQSEEFRSSGADEAEKNTQLSQEIVESQDGGEKSQSNINQTILDDWEDTDSQHSEKHEAAMKEAAENVHKLMDDWEEEDEEEKKDTE